MLFFAVSVLSWRRLSPPRPLVRMMAAQVTVFSTPGCPHCVRAKTLLKRLDVAYTEVDVSNPAERKSLAERAGQTSVPQIYADDVRVGGADDLFDAFETGTLARVLDVSKPLELREEEAKVTERTGALDVTTLHEPGGPLNVLRRDHGPARARTKEEDSGDPARTLQRTALNLIDSHVGDRGVDYEALRFSPAFAEFVAAAADLASLDEASLSDAAFVNAYNALVMHASTVVGHPRNNEERAAFFTGRSGGTYRIGENEYSLDDLEHGVLRRSRDARGFKQSDPRRPLFERRPFDNRIHFALNCGAKSCPPVKLFGDATYDEDLDAATRSFVSSETSLDRVEGKTTLHLSKLFLWYAGDFVDGLLGIGDVVSLEAAVKARSRDLARAVADLVPGSTLADDITAFLADSDEEDLTLSFADYDWSQNSDDSSSSSNSK